MNLISIIPIEKEHTCHTDPFIDSPTRPQKHLSNKGLTEIYFPLEYQRI